MGSDSYGTELLMCVMLTKAVSCTVNGSNGHTKTHHALPAHVLADKVRSSLVKKVKHLAANDPEILRSRWRRPK